MTGTSKNINYTGDETIGHLHIDAGQTTLNELTGVGTDTFTCSSILIDAGTTFTSTSGTIDITSESGDYAINNIGTFTPNGGLLKITTDDNTAIKGNEWGNLEIDLDTTTDVCNWRDQTGNAVTINGDLTVTDGDFNSHTVTDTLTINGNTHIGANGSFNGDGDQTGLITHNGLVTNLGNMK